MLLNTDEKWEDFEIHIPVDTIHLKLQSYANNIGLNKQIV